MTVKQLIELLDLLPDDAILVLRNPDGEFVTPMDVALSTAEDHIYFTGLDNSP